MVSNEAAINESGRGGDDDASGFKDESDRRKHPEDYDAGDEEHHPETLTAPPVMFIKPPILMMPSLTLNISFSCIYIKYIQYECQDW